MGQGQAGGTAEASGLAGLNLYDGSDTDQSESPRCTERASRDTGYRHGVARVGAPMRCASPGSTGP